MARFFLTRRAYHDLFEIEDYTLGKWGQRQADLYMDQLYAAFARIAKDPEVGRLRQDRSYPFYMAPAMEHFAIYKVVDQGIIIATVLYGRRDIESIIRNLLTTLTREINEMESRH